MTTQINFALKRYGFYQADIWGELLSPLRRLKFRKASRALVPMARHIAPNYGISYRGRFKKGSRTPGSRSLYMRFFLMRFYLGLKRTSYQRLYRSAIRSTPLSRRYFVQNASAPFDRFFTLLESRVTAIVQRAFLARSHTLYANLFHTVNS